MASLVSDGNGRWRVQIGCDGKRCTVRLGKASRRQAESTRRHVEHLASAKSNGGSIEPGTADWLRSIDIVLRDRLARVGLVEPVSVLNVGQLVAVCLERQGKTVKPQTLVRLQQSKRSLLGYFTAGRSISSVTEGDAEDYRVALLGEGLAEATVRKRCSDARCWFRYAVRKGWLRSNPLEVVPTAAIATADLRYISEADAVRVLDQITDSDLRLLFVLSRWGGLRVVSEPRALTLTLDCIDWEGGRLVVKSPKTQRHAGHEQRMIPMFPELVEPLQAAFDRAEPGQVYVLPMLRRKSSAALRKPMYAAIRRAGLKPWPRLWHNLRASRQTDLEAKFPSHVVCAWMGNSQAIARRHYLQVLDSDYERAVGGKAAQKAAQQMHANSDNERHRRNVDAGEGADFPVNTADCCSVPAGAGAPNDPDGI